MPRLPFDHDLPCLSAIPVHRGQATGDQFSRAVGLLTLPASVCMDHRERIDTPVGRRILAAFAPAFLVNEQPSP